MKGGFTDPQTFYVLCVIVCWLLAYTYREKLCDIASFGLFLCVSRYVWPAYYRKAVTACP